MTVWLTPQEAADHIKVCTRLIQAAVKAGELPAYPIGRGREYRLKASEVDEWMSSRAYEPGRPL